MPIICSENTFNPVLTLPITPFPIHAFLTLLSFSNKSSLSNNLSFQFVLRLHDRCGDTLDVSSLIWGPPSLVSNVTHALDKSGQDLDVVILLHTFTTLTILFRLRIEEKQTLANSVYYRGLGNTYLLSRSIA